MEQESGLESSAVQLVHLRKRMVYLGFENRKWQAQDRSTWVSRWIGRHTWVSWWIGRQAEWATSRQKTKSSGSL